MNTNQGQLAALKNATLRQVVALPARFTTLVSMLDRPEWQVRYALESLRADGFVYYSRGFWRHKSREASPARRRV
jgi:hypothetical protein